MNVYKRKLITSVVGIVELIIGILLLIDPARFTGGIIITAGVVLMLRGLISIVRYFRTEPEGAAASFMFAKGLAMAIAGAFCAFRSAWFAATFPVLTLLYAVAMLFTGLVKLQWASDMLRMKQGRWLPTMIAAALSLACGIVIISCPFSTTAVLWTFTGVSLIAEAVLDFASAFFVNKTVEEK